MIDAQFAAAHGHQQALAAQVDLLTAERDRLRSALQLIRETGDRHSMTVAARALREGTT